MDNYYNDIIRIYKNYLNVNLNNFIDWKYREKGFTRILVSPFINEKNTFLIINIKPILINICVINNSYNIYNFNIGFITNYNLFRKVQKLFKYYYSNNLKSDFKLNIYNIKNNDINDKIMNSLSELNVRNLKISKLKNNNETYKIF